MPNVKQAGQKIKLVVCDLDGTLLNSQKQISRRNLAAIQAARAKGIEVTICTGRISSMLLVYSRAIGLTGPLAAANGAVLMNGHTGEVLSALPLPPQPVQALLAYCLEHRLDCGILTLEGGYFTPSNRRVARFEQYNQFALQQGLSPMAIGLADSHFQAGQAGCITKVLISGLAEQEKQAAELFLLQYPGLGYTTSEAGLLDISAAGIDKGLGVRRLCQMLGVQKEEVCVFGDYYNDLPMFSEAGLAVAMGNAPEAVQHSADRIAPSNDRDGVAAILTEYFL